MVLAYEFVVIDFLRSLIDDVMSGWQERRFVSTSMRQTTVTTCRRTAPGSSREPADKNFSLASLEVWFDLQYFRTL